MPLVLPTADQIQRPEPRPSVSVVPIRNAGAPGAAVAGVGAGLEQFSEQIDRAAERQDTLRVEDAFNQLRAVQVDLSVGDKGFNNAKGGQVFSDNFAKNYTGSFDNYVEQLSSGLSNDRQRRMFAARAELAKVQFQSGLLQHISQQSDVYDKQVTDGVISAETANIASNPSDENNFKASVARMDAAITSFGQKNGAAPEALDAAKRKTLDDAIVARLQAWQLANPVGAFTAYQQLADRLSPQTRLQMEHQLFSAAAPVFADMVVAKKVQDDPTAGYLTRIDAYKPTGIEAVDALPQNQKTQVIEIAKQVQNGFRVEAERQRVEAERQRKLAQDQRQNEFLDQWNQHKLDATTVVKDPVLDFGQKHVLLNMLDEQSKGEMKTDPRAFISLFNRIHLPDGNPGKITNEDDLLGYVKAKGGIDFEDLQKLRKEMRDLRDPEQGPFARKLQDVYKIAESDLTKTNNLAGIKDPKGDELLYEWKWEVDRRISEWKKQGKDPFELLDPGNPNYVGKLISGYRRSQLQVIQDMADQMRSQNVPQAQAPVPTPAPAPAPVAAPEPQIPASAAAKLKEGVETTFKNGQVWTLENGKPKRVR